jgi:hypothetical protein
MTGLGWKSFHAERQAERAHVLLEPWHPNAFLETIGTDDFDAFMRRVVESYPGYLTQMYGWYAPPGEVDFVGHTERLADDLIEALRISGTAHDEEAIRATEKVNTSSKRIERPTWDPGLRAAVYRLEAPVFERFGYD